MGFEYKPRLTMRFYRERLRAGRLLNAYSGKVEGKPKRNWSAELSPRDWESYCRAF